MTVINSTMFYTEFIRSIKAYLHSYSFKTPVDALEVFSKMHIKNVIVYKNWDSVEETPISNEKTKGKNDIHHGCNFNICEDQKIIFLEELRILILNIMQIVEPPCRKTLQRYHFFIHLLELSIDKKKTDYLKINEFLNANFAIDSTDLILNACRGNYGTLSELQPELSSAIEELQHLRMKKAGKDMFLIWKEKYGVSNLLFKIFTGEYRDFTNSLEEYCYFLHHGIEYNCTDEISRIIRGDVAPMHMLEPGLLKLVFLLVYPLPEISKYEKCFEQLFQETFDMDCLIGLEFLSFSRKCAFYFEHLINKIPLNCVMVESLMRFATKNSLNKDLMIKRFSHYLQDHGSYDQLCRFVLNNSIYDFNYTKEFMEFFVKNFNRYKEFASDKIMNDPGISFISKIGILDTLDETSLKELFKSKYFLFFSDQIIHFISTKVDLDERLILELMNHLFNFEIRLGLSFKDHKTALAHKLLKCQSKQSY
ncbi:hypothetical protein GINT2_000192 [Glugoides intestinalis]